MARIASTSSGGSPSGSPSTSSSTSTVLPPSAAGNHRSNMAS